MNTATGRRGFLRPDAMAAGVAVGAAVAGIPCTPHMSDGGLGYLYVAHYASCVPRRDRKRAVEAARERC